MNDASADTCFPPFPESEPLFKAFMASGQLVLCLMILLMFSYCPQKNHQNGKQYAPSSIGEQHNQGQSWNHFYLNKRVVMQTNSKSIQMYKTEFFVKIVNDWKMLTILDVGLGSEYASGYRENLNLF